MTLLQRKFVAFNLNNNTIHETHSSDSYDRSVIDCILYKKAYNRVSDVEWKEIMTSLNRFKTEEMISHKDSVKNLRIH
jgi:hypothetical protein